MRGDAGAARPEFFAGFEAFNRDVGATTIHGVHAAGAHGSSGLDPLPVLLLHGFPQSHVLWHRIGPALAAEGRAVVATDLRGYGDSGRPPDGDDHSGFSFRAMAADQVEVMSRLGYDRFAVVPHDRGARVAHRMALDHPPAVARLVLMDILPTSYVYSHVDRRLATAYYHWFFFIQPYDLPERLIGADPAFFLRSLLGGWGGAGLAHHDSAALAEYERCFADPDVRHAMLEDYRAGASIDLRHDAASEDAGERIGCATHVLWGADGVIGASPDDPVAVWQSRASDPSLVSGQAIDGAGHFLAEDQPAVTLEAVRAFLAAGDSVGVTGHPPAGGAAGE